MSKKPEVPAKRMTLKEAESLIPEASADDPIYTRGYALGVKRPPASQPEKKYSRLEEASADDPIYKRGYHVGYTKHVPTRQAPAPVDPDKKK